MSIGIDSSRPLGRVGFDDKRHKTTFCVSVQQFDSKTAGIRLRGIDEFTNRSIFIIYQLFRFYYFLVYIYFILLSKVCLLLVTSPKY